MGDGRQAVSQRGNVKTSRYDTIIEQQQVILAALAELERRLNDIAALIRQHRPMQ